MNIFTHVRAFCYGFKDGWSQPHDLCWSHNVEHLPGYDFQVQNTLDLGINWGQLIRSPRHHQEIEGRYFWKVTK